MKAKITPRAIRDLKVPRGQAAAILWDVQPRGFHVRKSAGGGVFFRVTRSAPGGKRQTVTISDAYPTGDAVDSEAQAKAIAAAKEQAEEIVKAIRDGRDVLAEREAVKEQAETEVENTVSALVKDYIEARLRAGKLKESTADLYRQLATVYVDREITDDPKGERKAKEQRVRKVTLGERHVTGITLADMELLLAACGTRKTAFNHARELLRAAYRWGAKKGKVPAGVTNPADYVDAYKKVSKVRHLEQEDLQQLARGFRAAEQDGSTSESSLRCLRLLMLTGFRRDEWRASKWSFVDWQEARLCLPDSKVGEIELPLSAAALGYLQHERGRVAGEWICPDETGERPITKAKLRSDWHRILKACELDRLRIHDLRHCFASVALSAGISLAELQPLLGHRQVSTTAKYAKFLRSAKSAAADRAGTIVLAHLGDDFVPLAEVAQ